MRDLVCLEINFEMERKAHNYFLHLQIKQNTVINTNMNEET